MLKTAFYESFLYKSLSFVDSSYKSSKVKSAFDKAGFFASQSTLGRAYDKFKAKKPFNKTSVYQKVLDKASALISVPALVLNGFLTRLAGGSRFCSVYMEFLNNTPVNRLRACGIFGFYFFLTVTGLGVLGYVERGHTAICFAVSIVLLVFSLTADRLAAVLNDSFIIKLLRELIR